VENRCQGNAGGPPQSRIATVHVLWVYSAALLVPGLPIGILVWNVATFWAEDGSAGLPARLTAGGIATTLAAAMLGTLSLLSEHRAGPGQGLGLRQSSTIVVRGGPDLPYRVKVALVSLLAEVRHADANAGRYTAETGWSWGSSGEHVTVELRGDPAHPEARISSPWWAARGIVDRPLLARSRGNVRRV
jgi:hypothetical protein